MWGNFGNFSDLAKAAQDLQNAAASIQTPVATPFGGGGFFNMDALQQQEVKKEPSKPQAPPGAPVSSQPHKPLTAFTQPQVPAPKPPINVKGKLVVPKAKMATPTKAPSTGGMFETPQPPPKPAQALNSDSLSGAFIPILIPSNAEEAKPPGDVAETSAQTEPSLLPIVDETSFQEVEQAAVQEVAKEKEDDTPTSMVEDEPVPPETGDFAHEKEAEESMVHLDDTKEGEESMINFDNQAPSVEPESLSAEVPTADLLSTDVPDATPISVVPPEAIDTTPAVVGGDDKETATDSFPETPVGIGEPSGDNVIPTTTQQAPQKMHRDGITPAKPSTDESTAGQAVEVPEHVLEQFSSQLKRLEDNHQMDMQVLQEQHQQELQELTTQLQRLQQDLNHVQGEKNRQKESLTLQLNSLKHELEGTQQLLQAKGKDDRKLQDSHLKQLRAMEKEMNRKEEENVELKQELKQKEKTLEEVKEELQTSRDEYATLKERVKAVAGELKERRMECRTLQSEVGLLKDANYSLNDKITSLEAQGMDMNKSSQETTAELSSLRGELMDKEKELQEARAAIAAETKKGDEALAAYKKKAQQSLSVANARTASAIQAKEEAEMEARAARSTADSAMEKAVKAEFNAKEAMAEAKAYVKDMQQQVAQLDDIKAQLEEAKTQLERVRFDASTAQESNEKLRCELQSLQGRYEAEQITNGEYRKELEQASERSTELLEEVERLRREGQRLRDELKRAVAEKKEDDKSATNGGSGVEMVPAKRTAEAEATIAMLQQELQDANQAIRELKETLKATVEEQSRNQPAIQNGGHHHSDSSGGVPLFYAMEKQAELTQARNEIARLAGLLGNSEASKQEAIEEMEETRRQLLDVQSKLERQSRLKSTPEEERVNLEYLKNVILSFLNAKTLLEKKTLLPVIGTVLCLTPEEQQKAMNQLEKDGKLSLDTVTTSVMNQWWSK